MKACEGKGLSTPVVVAARTSRGTPPAPEEMNMNNGAKNGNTGLNPMTQGAAARKPGTGNIAK